MIQRLQHKYALSRQGAVDMVKACISVAISNFCLMMPAGILFLLINDLLEGGLKKDRIWIYAVGSTFVLILIALTNYIQYNATFLSTYKPDRSQSRSLSQTPDRFPSNGRLTLPILFYRFFRLPDFWKLEKAVRLTLRFRLL